MAAVDLCTFSHGLGIYIRILSLAFAREKIIEWLNEHKSTAAMNYFFSNMANTVICMTLGYLRIHHATAVPFSPLHI